MKKDNRGFLLAESLVVSTFVLTILILLYIQFSNLITNYKNSYNYNNVESIYDLSSVANYLNIASIDLSSQLTVDKPYVTIYKDGSCNIDAGIVDPFCDNLINKMGANKIIYTSSDIQIIKDYVSNHNDSEINQKLREFISRVETNTILNKGRLFAEFNNGTYATIAVDIASELTENTLTTNDLKDLAVTSGDGLYKDTYENDRFIYKGTNPNNYITFNNEMWRILSVEADGSLKIIKNESIGDMIFDTDNSNWETSDIKTYLNGEYLNSIGTNKGKIISHKWSIGAITSDNADLKGQITSENSTLSQEANVGLITVSEYIRANNKAECNSFAANNTNTSTCKTTNWLSKNLSLWTITPNMSESRFIFTIAADGTVSNAGTDFGSSTFPVVYLASDTTLTGDGSQNNSFQIK